MTELDDSLREHFSSVALDAQALSRIHCAAQHHEVSMEGRAQSGFTLFRQWRNGLAQWSAELLSPGEKGSNRSGASMLRYAAIGAVIVAVGLSMRSAGTIEERGDQAMREVAMNHVTRLSFEFEGDSLASLDSNMNQLPFELSEPSRLPANTEVLGSRYCSLSGQLAAHVKLRENDTGRPLSLFVTRSGEALNRLNGENRYVDGVEVELFYEGGLFYALARQAG